MSRRLSSSAQSTDTVDGPVLVLGRAPPSLSPDVEVLVRVLSSVCWLDRLVVVE